MCRITVTKVLRLFLQCAMSKLLNELLIQPHLSPFWPEFMIRFIKASSATLMVGAVYESNIICLTNY